ncbi:MAG: hypothetical protein ABFC96_04105 [Thermoguttaceae bacterium]
MNPALRAKHAIDWTLAITALVEGVTVAMRFGSGVSAAEFNATAPLLLQIHHMFWSLPLLAALPLVWRRQKLSGTLLGVALGLIFSDLVHHFVVLPVLVGNTGWHWP